MGKASLFLIMIIHIVVIREYVFSRKMIRICYFNAVARYRNADVRFDTYNIDFSLCTHYVYGHAKIGTLSLHPMDPSEILPTGAYKNFTGKNSPLKTKVKTLLSIGGPNQTEFNNAMNLLVISDEDVGKFAVKAVEFCLLYGFDGLDIDWVFRPESNIMSSFVKLLKIMRAEMDHRPPTPDTKYLLTVKLPPDFSQLTHAFDPPAISRYADYIILAMYDLPSPNPKEAWFGSPMFPNLRYPDHISVKPAVLKWLKAGLLPNKTVLGLAPLGNFYSLVDQSKFKPGSPVNDVVLTGKMFNIHNHLAFPEICEISQNATRHFDPTAFMPYITNMGYWVGYEDKTSIMEKMTFAYDMYLAGVMFPAIDLDDFNGKACRHGPFPMLHIINEATERITRIKESTPNKAHTQAYAHLFVIFLLSHLYF